MVELLKKIHQMEDIALMQGYQTIKKLLGFRQRGRPKNKVNLASDNIVVVLVRATRNMVSERKRTSPATSEQGGVRKKKVNLSRTKWGIGENLLNIFCAKEEWTVNSEAGILTKFSCKGGIP